MPDHLRVQGWFAMLLHCDSSPVDASPPADTSDLRTAGLCASSTVDARQATALVHYAHYAGSQTNPGRVIQPPSDVRIAGLDASSRRQRGRWGGGGGGAATLRQAGPRSTLSCAHGRELWGACACALTFVRACARWLQTENQAGMRSGNQAGRRTDRQAGIQAKRQENGQTGRDKDR